MRDIVELKEIDYNKLKHFSLEPCPDQVVGRLEYDKKQGFIFVHDIKTKSHESNFIRTNIDNNYNPNTSNVIVLVLESPHKDEYDKFNRIRAIGPAFGHTGENINKYFAYVLNIALLKQTMRTPEKYGIYDLVLINAIQYQCSLGESTSIYRDDMFLHLWIEKKCNEDFLNRINTLLLKYSGDKIVINCCTQGKHKLQNLVENEIDNCASIKHHYMCAHPSSWFIPDLK